jgi:fumarate hydratase subunit beta
MTIAITTPLQPSIVESLRAGDEVLISGTIFTARDAAHKRLTELIENNKPLPIELKNQIIYYTGPTPAQPGKVIGSAGPTTGSRMDPYTPLLIKSSGLRGIIGKGNRNSDVKKALVDFGCIYFVAIGGAGALLSKCITSSEIVCYEDLGAEAIYKLTVKDFPVIVAIDTEGNNVYERL